jgi:hypothetical protein
MPIAQEGDSRWREIGENCMVDGACREQGLCFV